MILPTDPLNPCAIRILVDHNVDIELIGVEKRTHPRQKAMFCLSTASSPCNRNHIGHPILICHMVDKELHDAAFRVATGKARAVKIKPDKQ